MRMIGNCSISIDSTIFVSLLHIIEGKLFKTFPKLPNIYCLIRKIKLLNLSMSMTLISREKMLVGRH